ncbi:FAD-dependent monooxygenase [Streptomyces hypolithicus]
MDPVIVVGAGPVGLALALALSAQGVPSVVLDEGRGNDEPRTARTALLRADTADLLERLGCATVRDEGTRWTGWRSIRRHQNVRRIDFGDDADMPSPVHLAQHVLTRGLRDAVAAQELVEFVPDSRLDTIEQDHDGVTAHIREPGAAREPGAGEPGATRWRGSFLVGCDGARSTVRKLLDIRFPGRTAIERHAVAALRTELPWPGEAVLHRMPPWRTGGQEVTARPLRDDVWRLDWLLPPSGELVTPEALVTRVRDTLGGWCQETPPYELLDTGVYTLHHRLARTWRSGRAFLAGDAAHLLGALGTQGLDEGLRDVDNLAWKLAQAWHLGASETLLDSYQAERRTAVASRLRAADQALPILRGGGLLTYLPGTARGHDTLLTDGHLGRGALGAPPQYARSPLTAQDVEGRTAVRTPLGALIADVRATAPDGSSVWLRDRLRRGRQLVVLVAPGTGVWDRRHWMTAGVMPRLAAAVTALPVRAELLVTEGYPGASAHTVLLVRPDGHLAAAFNGVRPAELYSAADAARGGAPTAARTGPHPQRCGGAERPVTSDQAEDSTEGPTGDCTGDLTDRTADIN